MHHHPFPFAPACAGPGMEDGPTDGPALAQGPEAQGLRVNRFSMPRALGAQRPNGHCKNYGKSSKESIMDRGRPDGKIRESPIALI